MKLGNIHKLSYDQLACYTNNFCESNYVGHFQFGKFYRGKIVCSEWEQYVMVKIWEISVKYNYKEGDNEGRLMDEINLLRHEMLNNYPGLVKLYGYCLEGDHLGAVYEFKPFDTVYNLIPKDGFTWLQRLKVSLGFAKLLKFLHTVRCSGYKPFIVRNLDCAHIVLDEDYNPKLCDFGLITGGIFPDRTIYKCHHVIGSFGYIDLNAFYQDDFSDKIDVFAFGVILVSLISKRVYTEADRRNSVPCVPEWAWSKMEKYFEDYGETNSKRPRFSLVHQSLADEPDFDPSDGHKLSVLTFQCIRGPGCERPSMKEVLRYLLKLKAVKKHADFLGVNKVLSSYENDL